MFFNALVFISFHPVLAQPEIRIAVGNPVSQLILTGPELRIVAAENKQPEQRDVLRLSANHNGIVINGKNSDLQILNISSPGQISVDGKQYRNALEVKWQIDKNTPKVALIHSLPLETYVAGIVASEVPSKWPLEALKAQAISARTFAVWQKFRRLDKDYHMESSVIDQVYGGAQKEHALADQAARETFGQVLTYQGKPTQAYFHSTCGGQTESAFEAWGTAQPYLPGSQCGYCKNAAAYKWNYRITRTNFNRALHSFFPGEITDVTIIKKSKSGRAKSLQLSGKGQKKIISATTFRELLGYNNIRSTLIDSISFGTREVTFLGRGHGHGVGMCQWGALGMAKAGFSATQILERYYPGAEIRSLY